MATVDIQGVRKSFGDAEVVHGVDIAIGEGEFVVLVGPSGCGKSTLLRMIAGLEDVTGGVIRIDGEVVNHLPPKDRDIAMVFQNYALYPQMTVRKNMAFGLMLRKESKAEIEKRVSNAAEILDLTELLERYPRQLSGGQRQRVAMGRAIVRDPRVFLFDEPLSNLDAKLRVQMRTEIRALQKRLRTTSVYVTHDQVEAMTMADRIVVMHRGKIEQIDTPLDLYDRPCNMFVAGFIGSPAMNFIPGVIHGDGAGKALRTAEGVSLALPANCAGDVGREIVFGVRPEHLTISSDNDAAAMPAQLRHIEPTGSQTFVFAEVAGNAQICLISNDPRSLKVGSTVRLKPNPSSIYLFDKQSGQVIR